MTAADEEAIETRHGLGGVRGWAARQFVADRARWMLWLPAFGGAGIAVYFALPVEPPTWLGAVGIAVSLVGLSLGRRRPFGLGLAVAGLAVAVGFTLAQMRTATVAAPALSDALGPAVVTGRIVDIDHRPGTTRVVLDRLGVVDVAPGALPHRVRVRLIRADSGYGVTPPAGARVRVLAVLQPPPRPAAPGAFDFSRQLYFAGIGGVGYAIGPLTIVEQGGTTRLGALLEGWRQSMASRILQTLDGEAGAVAVALLVGERGGVSQSAYQAMRDAGIAHLLAISGLHVGLVAGFIFLTTRGGLALIEPVALTRPIKKWAAVVALLGAVGYMLMVGAPVPTQRAVIMTGLVLLAVMVDRVALSMRTVAWAAVVVLVLAPESLLGPSFQMSFAAVIALIAAYETATRRTRLLREGPAWWTRSVLYVVGVAATTVIASAATGLFAAYHFQRLAALGVVANLLAVPLTAFVIMPMGVLAYLLAPLGLDSVALSAMGWGIDGLLWVARQASAWPGAAVAVPAMPVWGLVAAALGGLWLCLWQQAWRWFGLAGIVIGVASIAVTPRADLLINDRGSLVAARLADGSWSVSSFRAGRFSRDVWLRRDGAGSADRWPEAGTTPNGELSCDPLGCLYRRGGMTIAIVRDPRAFAEDCAVADAVVATVPAPAFCDAAVIDRFDLWRNGAHSLAVRDGMVLVDSVAERVGDRPWALRR